MLRTTLIGLLVLGVMVTKGWANFNAFLIYNGGVAEPALSDSCFDGTPLPDGTIVSIFWDLDSDGPDDDDNLVPTGIGFDRANYNVFQMNGAAVLGHAGAFITDPLFTFGSNQPNPSRFWLRICIPGADRYWRSDIFSPVQGLQDIYFGSSVGSIPMVCVNASCTGCIPPPVVTGLTASQTLCQRIDVNWNLYNGSSLVDSLELRRSGSFLVRLGVEATSFVDTTLTGTTGLYEVLARTIDQIDTCFSVSQAISGRQRLIPSAPTNVATVNGNRNSVTVSWVNASSLQRIQSAYFAMAPM
ncbi:MAG: hypothetical protein IPP40_10360 [bacterium]|nr:hypothetical protein [bacterium]